MLYTVTRVFLYQQTPLIVILLFGCVLQSFSGKKEINDNPFRIILCIYICLSEQVTQTSITQQIIAKGKCSNIFFNTSDFWILIVTGVKFESTPIESE